MSHYIANSCPVPVIKFTGRRRLVLVVLIGCMAILFGRAFDLQVLDRKYFLQRQGKLRHVAVVSIPAHRGRILDRNGEPLAISTPVESVWTSPQQFQADPNDVKKLAQILEVPVTKVRQNLDRKTGRRFVYLKRRIDPTQAASIKRLNLHGLNFDNEYRRYYPTGEVTSHLIGFANVDDVGQEGLELAYDRWLRGSAGTKRVIRDGKKRIIEDLEKIRSPVQGNDLVLSIDQRLQYLAYRELKAAVKKHKARSGTLALLDSKNGEVLAMVNQPSFNPNTRRKLTANRYRNRAITDVFEPGSTIKPFVVSCALEAGSYHPDSLLDTAPGLIRVGRNVVRDIHNYGLLDVTRVLQKSSNVGITKMALSLSAHQLWGCYDSFGFARLPGTGFPGEAAGSLSNYTHWKPFAQATMSFGYGLSVSALQLARAYSVLANDGIMPTLSLLKKDQGEDSFRVMSKKTANTVKKMLETVVSREGTAWSARVPGYRVAGKTGTIKKPTIGGYSDKDYMAMFVGIAPVANPRLVMVVVIDEPSAGDYYGGLVAAPVFSKVMRIALRMLGVPPEQHQAIPLLMANQGESA